jgi:hypothetical protein
MSYSPCSADSYENNLITIWQRGMLARLLLAVSSCSQAAVDGAEIVPLVVFDIRLGKKV